MSGHVLRIADKCILLHGNCNQVMEVSLSQDDHGLTSCWDVCLINITQQF
jgi:hypothetical protein